MPIHLEVEAGPHRGVPRAELARRARAMCTCLQLGDSELSILLTGDDQIQKLNREYRHKDRPTDVLAFAMREGPKFVSSEGSSDGSLELLGDVVISVPRAREQAAARGADVMTEVTMLLAHGILHLLGWDHDTVAKDRRMRAETDRLCEAARPARSRTSKKRSPRPKYAGSVK